MAAKTRNISTLIESQLPGFIVSEYENFSKFVESYYEHLENQGQPLDIISNVTKYRDINFYEKNLLNQYTELSSSIAETDTTITVEDATSFPEQNGYIKIGNELCFYKERTGTQFLEVSRGVSGNTTLGDLYESTNFVTTQAEPHYTNDVVYNVSNLFLYAFIKSFESQYLGGFPEAYLKGDVDKRVLIKNISDFYKAKGTDKSIKFIFNSIVSKSADDTPETYNPKDFTLKASTSDWISNYSIKVKILTGDVNKLVGTKIVQKTETSYASAVIDAVNYGGSDGIFEIILSPSSINGNFKIAAQTTLRTDISVNDTVGNRIDVYSTLGWDKKGELIINSERILFIEKNVNQFIISGRSNPNTTHVAGTPVYSNDVITALYDGGSAIMLGLGVLYNLNVQDGKPYSNSGDKVQISESGFDSNHPVIDGANWFLNTNFRKAFSPLNSQVAQAIGNLNSDVSAIYEDDQYFYICSSGYPHHGLLKESSPANLEDQKFLKLVRKNPTNTTEVYPVSNRDVAILVDGSVAFSNKDFETVKYGKITSIAVENKGIGYQAPPFVLINNQPNKARCFLAGEVVDTIELLSNEIYTEDPEITITSGRNAKLTPVITNGEITSIKVTDQGEYYSSPPLIRIFDALGKGAFAEYEAIISPEGKLIRCKKISGGRFYNRNSIIVEVIAVGSGAYASAKIREWTKDRFEKYRLDLDSNNSYVFSNFDPKIGLGYGVVANPANLRFRSGDNINSVLGENPGSKIHSPILGFAYDGNPIYGPYGFSDPGNSNSTVVRLNSGYQLKTSRPDGPSILEYALGTFVDDYVWIPSVNTGKTELDENNGRFCVTPEYPNGTYAYFTTINSSGSPVFPYIIGKNFYALPVDSNYNSNISQDDLPKKLKRLRTSDIDNNGVNSFALIGDVTNGNVSGVYSDYSIETFSVGSELFVDNSNTEGFGAKAFVSSVNGKDTVSLESVQDKAIVIDLVESAYLFEGDVLFQGEGVLLNQIIVDNTEINDFQSSEAPNVKVVNDLAVGPDGLFRVIQDLSNELTQGEIIGDVINDNRVVLRSVQNTFDLSLPVFATIKVLNLLLNKNGTYTKNSIISFIREDDGIVFATALVLEGTLKQNSLKVRIITGDIFASDDFIIKSSILSDTSNAKIISTLSLSENLTINAINDQIAILQTNENHNLALGDKVFVNIFPDDEETETIYYVRKRLYQKVILQELTFNGKIIDTGIGRFEILNSGVDYESGTYEDVELIFVDSSKARKNIGKPGDPGNARATIEVFNIGGGFGRVASVTLTDKGYGYRKSDILTVADDDLQRLEISTRTARLNLFVDHVGFSAQNEELFLTSVNDLSKEDYLNVGNEIVKVLDINKESKSIIVERGQKNTTIGDHFNDQKITFEETSYKFENGYRILGDSQNSPYVVEYNAKTRELLVTYDYSVTNPTKILQSSIFFDQNIPNKFVRVESVESPQYKLEFSKDQNNFEINPTIEIQKYYKYKFDTSHPSMLDTYLDFSSSLNYNLFTEEKNVSSNLPGTSGSFVSIKLGFGPNISSNTYQNKIPVNFNNYYYFIKASADVNTNGSSLKVIDDPLSGEQSVIYSTDKKFVYNVKSLPQYDGSGEISYTTTSQFAIGSIANISLNDTGTNYKSIPVCKGILPSPSFVSTVTAKIDTTTGYLSSIVVDEQGSNYSKPVAIITDGDGFNYKLNCITEDGKVKAINIINPGKGFTYDPTIKIFESDVQVFLTSNNIGIPKNIRLINSGFGYNSDYSTIPTFKSTTTFVLKDFEDDSFYAGEKITQYENDVLIAEATVSKNGWRIGANLLKVENIKGIFKNNLPIKGFAKSKTATLIAQINTKFTPDIRTYSDNVGRFNSERGKLSSNSQKLTDSYFYQDYSYVIKSRTSIEFWRDLIRETTHPAGFQLFGELILESEGITSMPSEVKEIETHSFINLKPQNISVVNTKKYITENIVSFSDTNIERGIGSVSVDTFDSSETIARELILARPFDGDFDPNSGVIYGTKTFTLLDKRTNTAYAPYNECSLIITIDGVLQEPGKSFKIKGNTITFSQPPFGERVVEGQTVEAQKFYCRAIKFKDNTLNSTYIRKIQNISDQFDGEQRIFDLYEEDGSIVKSLPNEKFIVALNGVLQNARSTEEDPFENAYAIIRSQDPNTTDKIAFTEPPISHGELYNSTDDVVIREKCFIYSIGSYRRLSIDSRTVKYRGTGPFLILDEVENSVVSIDDSLYAIVFIDGVLQIPGKSYDIVGPNITFSSPLKYYEDKTGNPILQKVSILLFYGRDKAKTLTFYDFEPNAYYSQANLIIESPNTAAFYSWFANYLGSNVIVSQNGNVIGKIKSFVPKSIDLNLTLLCSSFFDVDNSVFTFTNPQSNNQFTLSSVQSSSINFLEDEDGNRKLKVDIPAWLYGTELGKSAYKERTKSYLNLNVGDLIKIDGESSFREIVSIPELVNTKQYNSGEFLPSDIYSRVESTNYNDIVRGEGLSITAEINADGTITKLNWNRRDLMLYFNNNVLLQPTAYQYYNPPIIEFLPRTQTGGGAKAEVIAIGGQIIDIVLIDGGYGYEEPPKVVVSRGYNRIKNKGRKVSSLSVLNISIQNPTYDSLITSSEVTLISYGPAGESIFSYINLSTSGGIKESEHELTYFVSTVKPETVIVRKTTDVSEIKVSQNFGIIGSTSSVISVDKEILINHNFNVTTSSTLSADNPQFTKFIEQQINEVYVQTDTDSINNIGAFLDAPLSETDTIVYIPNTDRFPDSSRLLIGKEIVYYERKKSDRFLDVSRGQDGTIAQTHEAGDYLVHLPKIITVISGGAIEVQSISSIDSLDKASLEILKTVNTEIVEYNVETNDSAVYFSFQKDIDVTTEQIIPNYITIVSVPLDVSTLSYSSTAITAESNVTASITSLFTSTKEVQAEIYINEEINIDNSVLITSNQYKIILPTNQQVENISSIVSTLKYNNIVINSGNQILSDAKLQFVSSSYVVSAEATVQIIQSSINTVKQINEEIILTLYFEPLDATIILSSQNNLQFNSIIDTVSSVSVYTSQEISLSIVENLNIEITDVNIIASTTSTSLSTDNTYTLTSIFSTLTYDQIEINCEHQLLENAEVQFTSLTHASEVASRVQTIQSSINTVKEVSREITLIPDILPLDASILVSSITNTRLNSIVEAISNVSISIPFERNIVIIDNLNIEIVNTNHLVSSSSTTLFADNSYTLSSTPSTITYDQTRVNYEYQILLDTQLQFVSSTHTTEFGTKIETIQSSTNAVKQITNEFVVYPDNILADNAGVVTSSTNIISNVIPGLQLFEQAAQVSITENSREIINFVNANVIENNNLVVSRIITSAYDQNTFNYLINTELNEINTEITSVAEGNILSIENQIATLSTVSFNNVEYINITGILPNLVDIVLPTTVTINTGINSGIVNLYSYIDNIVEQSIPEIIESQILIEDLAPEKVETQIRLIKEAGIVDYFVEPYILANTIETRSGDYSLDSALYNSVILRDDTTVLIRNSNNYNSLSDKFTLGNAGHTLNVLDHNKFISVGIFDVNNNLRDFINILPNVTMRDIIERGNSAITLNNEIFNVGIPSINNIGTTLQNSITSSSDQIVMSIGTTNNFPNSGKIIINGEVIEYSSKSGNVLQNVTRGVDNTIASSHDAGDYLQSL